MGLRLAVAALFAFSIPAIIPAARAAADVAPQAVAEIEALLQRARDSGIRSLSANDRNLKNAAKKDLQDAERVIKAELKRDAGCEACVVGQAAVHFYRSVFGIAKEYDECLETTVKGLERFPQNPKLALFKGYSHYNRNEMRQAATALRRFVMLAPTDPMAEQARKLADDSQQRFMGGWYNQANFYQSNESRIVNYNPQTARNEVVFQVTPELETQLGQQGFVAVTQGAAPANDPEAVAFIRQLVGRIVEKTPGPAFRYEVTLLDSAAVNAVTPPGHIVVFTGLLRFVDTEAQLASVIAHELAHNYGHHSARRVVKALLGQNIAANVTKLVNPQGAASQALMQLSASTVLGLILQAYSRFEETEADHYGAHLMFNAGYNPTAMSSFFLKLYEANPKQPIKFLSTHPPHPDRINSLSDYLGSFPLDRELVVDSSEAFKRLKQRYPSPTAVAIPRVAE